MHYELGMRPILEQRQLLLPRMLQAIEILQMPTPALWAKVDHALIENEVLETLPEEPGERRLAPREGDGYPLETLEAPGPDLQTYLCGQLALADAPAALVDLAVFLVGRLDPNGHLDEEAARTALGEVSGEAFDEALALLRSLDPPGIGRSGPIESMIAQIPEDDPDRETLVVLLREHLPDLAKNRKPKVSAALGLELSELPRLIDRMKELSPCPGREFTRLLERPIRPDLVVRRSEGAWVIQLAEESVPRLAIREDYRRMAGDRKVPKEVRRHLRTRLGEARDLIQALEQRRETLVRIAEAVFARQRAFLEKGVQGLRPLGMQEIADAVGVHLSTVSRAIAEKYVETDHGVHPLRMFFDGGKGVGSGQGGEGRTRTAIKERLAGMIEEEDRRAPLSDEEIAEEFRKEGVDLARRTVAKYRKELGIPSSWRRKVHESPGKG